MSDGQKSESGSSLVTHHSSLVTDYFERLGLPRRFSVDAAVIEREYLARSRSVHPDFHQLGSAAEQRASLELTAALNEAYLTLKDPYRRAEYLLGLLGGPTAQQEKNHDQAFLMEMMEFRERIEAAKGSTPCSADLDRVRAELEEIDADRMATVADEFGRLEGLSPEAPKRLSHLLGVRRSLNALKTVRSLLRELESD
jgi:molecular chaperone HscB